MKRKFLLATAKGRTAWVLLVLALLTLPTSAVIASRTNLPGMDISAPVETTTEDRQIPVWEGPLDEFENVPVTYSPVKGAVELAKTEDIKTPSAEETEFNQIDNPSSWPDSTTVKVIATWPSADTTECSGVLVAERTILTAGHCVFTHTTDFCDGEDSCWPADLQIYTHYGTQDEQESDYTKILTWTAWTQNRDYDYDLAGVRLNQAFGNEVGWLGFGYNNNVTENDFFLDKTFEHTSYSGGSFLEWEGLITAIEDHQLYSDGLSNYGQSGAGAYRKDYGQIVYSVLSHHTVDSPKTGHTRITAHKFIALNDWIRGLIGDPDIIIFMPFFAN